jgi:hypothetical protein
MWPPLEYVLRLLVEPQIAITLGLSIVSFGLWQLLKRGVNSWILLVTATAMCCYLALTAIVIASALIYLARHPEIWQSWQDLVFAARLDSGDGFARPDYAWLSAWLGIMLWSFPQMALGLSGFEMITNVVPQVSGGTGIKVELMAVRVRNTRKLMVTAAAIMAVYLVSAVVVTTLVVPGEELLPGGAAQHRALAYLAHGSPLDNGLSGAALNPMFRACSCFASLA